MLHLLTTDDFAEWFSALGDEAAEDVAATLEVIRQLGAWKEAPGSSEWLLWYEHPSVSALVRRSAPLPGVEALAQELMNEYGAFLGYVKRITTHLESGPFVSRLRRLPPENAAAVARGTGRIRDITSWRRRAMVLGAAQRGRIAQPSDSADGGTRAPGNARHLLAGMRGLQEEARQAYFAVLAAAGFEVVDVPAHSSALREVALRSREPSLRMLYGVDAPRNRALVVLGEWLDRSFYGHSVRRAEHAWRQFLDGDLAVTELAKAR
jgi:hypothetical protein